MQNDQLTINEIKVDKEDFRKEFPPNTQVNIKFSSKTDKSKGGKGFVICFRRLNEQEKNDKSACDGIFELGKDPKLTFDKDMQLEHGTIEDSTTVYTTSRRQTFKSTPSTDQQCIKCLERKRPKEKCKKLCCKGKVTYPQCQSQAFSTTTTTPTKGKCKVKKNRIDKLCKNCVNGKIKCGKKENCHSCCPGKSISPKCRKRKGGRNRKKKDRKKKRTKSEKKDKKGS
ncbi:unnamed protein product [Mytilus coruscus]|uniref:Uncharacterized protein n=1 Tax=Mytilus coruscus TaxID=42192 RepID=A0A6J8CXA9_MYTCO|nr:unnamed protein product [Mytilus coruscus]